MSANLDKLLTYAPKISLRSRLLHALGCVFIGTPASMGMPADFYYIEADREFPGPDGLSWQEKRKRIYTDHFRRALTHKVALYSCVAAVLLSLAGFAINSSVRGARSWVSSHGAGSDANRAADSDWNLARCRQEYEKAMMRGDRFEMKRIENTCASVQE